MAAQAWAAIKEALRAIGVTLSESGTVTQAIGNSLLSNMMSMVETSEHMNTRLEQSENTMNMINMMVSNEFRNLNDKVAHMQGLIDNNNNRNAPHRRHGILESKSVSNMKSLGSDKTGFRMWNEKLINIVSQIRPGSRRFFAAISEYIDRDNDIDGDAFRIGFNDSGDLKDMEDRGTSYDDMNEDLYVLLTDKTEGEAAIRVRGCSIGDGVEAYMTVYKWYTGTSGQAISDRIRRLMSPGAPKSESDIADAIDRWVDSGRVLEI